MLNKINIQKIELSKKPAKVVFSFEDGTKAIFYGNTENGTCEIELSSTKKGSNAFDFVFFHTCVEDPQSSKFWFYLMEIIENYKTLVYEG